MNVSRVLSIDGGGNKGLFAAYFMKQFCLDAGIPIRDANGTLNPEGDYSDIREYFDVITGSSIGGISALAYACGYSPNYLIRFFRENAARIFTSISGTPMPTSQKGAIAGLYRLFPTDTSLASSFYGDNSVTDVGVCLNRVLMDLLITAFGDTKMVQIKGTNVLITSVEVTQGPKHDLIFKPVLFSNLSLPGLIGQNYEIVDVALATSAAPTYFPPTTIPRVYGGTIGGIHYIDGGDYDNNPAALGYGLATILTQGISSRICVLSTGCGLGTTGYFDPTTPPAQANAPGLLGNFFYLVDLLGIAITGAQEAIDKQMQWLSKFNRNLFYFRFQTIFDPQIDTEMDNSSQVFLDYMQLACDRQYATDKQRILAFIQNGHFQQSIN